MEQLAILFFLPFLLLLCLVVQLLVSTAPRHHTFLYLPSSLQLEIKSFLFQIKTIKPHVLSLAIRIN